MGQRSRKRRKDPAPDAAMRRGYARSEARNAEVRAQLRPYAPGERPRVLVICSALALAFAIGNVVLYAVGYEVQAGKQPTPQGTFIFVAIMVVAAVGMWQKRYWAVLGFQALLGLTIIVAAFGLIQAGNIQAAALTVVVIALAGTLFWFLIKVMARIQTPQRPTRG